MGQIFNLLAAYATMSAKWIYDDVNDNDDDDDDDDDELLC